MWIKKIEIEEVVVFEIKGSGGKFFIGINFMERLIFYNSLSKV